MALAELLSALERDAAAEVEAIDSAAAAEVAALRAAAETRLEGERDLELAVLARELEASAGAEIAALTRRLRAETLAARAAMLERVRAAVSDRLGALLDGGGDALAAGLIESAIAAAGGEAAAVRCCASLAPRVRELGLEVRVDPRVTGLVLDLAGGRGQIDASLEGYLERAWPALQVAAVAAVDGVDAEDAA